MIQKGSHTCSHLLAVATTGKMAVVFGRRYFAAAIVQNIDAVVAAAVAAGILVAGWNIDRQWGCNQHGHCQKVCDRRCSWSLQEAGWKWVWE